MHISVLYLLVSYSFDLLLMGSFVSCWNPRGGQFLCIFLYNLCSVLGAGYTFLVGILEVGVVVEVASVLLTC